jgi:hypothetical protein
LPTATEEPAEFYCCCTLNYADEIKKKLPKIYSKDLIDVLFRLPYTKRRHLIDAGIGTPKTVGNYLMALEEKGFLTSEKAGKEKLYLNRRMLTIWEST